MFEQFEAYWAKFKLKKRMLVQTEPFNEKRFQNNVIDQMRKCVAKEAKFNSFNTCESLLTLLFSYE